MNQKTIIRLLRHADAEEISENWPFPDEKAGERIADRLHRTGELPMADTVQDEVLIVKHSGFGRFAAIAAVCMLAAGTVGGIWLTRHLHSQRPVTELPAAEEELTAGTQPETAELPVIATVYAEDPAASDAVEQPKRTAGEPEAGQAATDVSEPAAMPEKTTEKPERKPAETAPAKQTATEQTVQETAEKVRETTAPTQAVQETAAPTEAVTESPKSAERITLAEAIRICRESDTAWKAAKCIEQRYAADERFGSGVEFDTYYIDDAKTESINILYNAGIIIFYKSPQESAGMTAQNHRILTAAGQQVWTLLEWQRTEMEKSDSVLTEEQKAQLRALDEEEKSLWATSYIRRRLEIMGAMSPNAPRPTIEDVERLLAQSDSTGQAARNLLNLYVPDYEWGSGVSGLAYRLSDTETINIVECGGISIDYENTATGEHREFCR
ncbi:MAG: hypothetical protein IKN55_04780 [Oscillospiraceae bacterium]|nr:hypothetical protein [Oscillospiraceae bacterium]